MKVARQAVCAAVRGLDEALRLLARRSTINAVHDARGAARNLGDTLRAFDVEPPVLKEQARALKDACGEVRDLHVSGARRGATLARATKAMRATMADWERSRPIVDAELAHVVGRVDPKKLLRRTLRKLQKQIAKLPRRAPPYRAHRLRVKAKRAQTAVALLAPEETGLLKKLKRTAQALGKLHDLDAGLEAQVSRKRLLRDVAPALEKLRHAL